jgi:hypothetical protein
LAEWLSKNAGASDHHHHDPYHLDQNGDRTYYKRPGGGYQGTEGQGFDHVGKNEFSGYYGMANWLYKPENTDWIEDPKVVMYRIGVNMDTSKEIRPWWHKLERDDFNGMAPRKSYDALASEIKAKNPDVNIRDLAKTVLNKENEYQAKAQAQRLTPEVK